MIKFIEKYPPLLTTEEAAKLLGVSPTTIRTNIKKSLISAAKIHGEYRIPKECLIDYMLGLTRQ